MLRSATRLLAASLLLVLSSAKVAIPHIQHSIRRGQVPSRAVNLGGWLVAEGWMSYDSPLWKDVPSNEIFNGEHNAMKILGTTKGNAQFKQHRDTWITEDDIAEIAKSGLNTVRVPIGYWIMADDPVAGKDAPAVCSEYAPGSLAYLDKLIKNWAVKYNVAVMLSFHGHMGSQNGMDNSGPVTMNKAEWGKTDETAKNSLAVATFLADRYKNNAAFLGLNLMNEPKGVSYGPLLQYYQDAYKAIRATGNQCIIGTSPMLSDQGPPTMSNFMPCPEYYNVWHEYHIYYKWGWENAGGAQAILNGAVGYKSSHITPWTGNPLYIGEWSLATPDNTVLTKEQFKTLAKEQLANYETAPPGWAFWSWRHSDENATLSGWSLRQMLDEGVLTIPTATNRSQDILTEFCPFNDTSSNSTDELDSGSASASNSGADDSAAMVKPSKASDDDNIALSTKAVQPESSGAAKMASAVLAAGVCMVVGVLSL